MQFFGGNCGAVKPLTKKRPVENPEGSLQKNESASNWIIKYEELQRIRKQAEQKFTAGKFSNFSIIQSNQCINHVQKEMLIILEVEATAQKISFERMFEEWNTILDSQNFIPEQLPPQYYKNEAEIELKNQQMIQKTQTTSKRHLDILQQQLELQEEAELLKEQNRRLEFEIEREKEQIEKQNKEIEVMNKRKQYFDNLSRILFEDKKKNNNFLQQSKGNIRVYCRLRPCKSIQRMDYEITQNLLKIKKEAKDFKQTIKLAEPNFLFEKVFAEDASQADVFDELSELVQCSIDGKNVCIFAYGQTGSGKTYTMNGNLEGDESQRGFIPRSMDYIFKQAEISKERGYKSKISISVSEIYNNQHIDLLGKDEHKSKNSHFESKKITGAERRMEKQLQFAEVSSFKEGLLLLQDAIKFRATGNTQMNIESSRSHLIFEIKNESENKDRNISRTSSLVLIDLAGSERISQTLAKGDRLEESKSINLSLTELRKALRNLKDGGVQTFRGSKLTSVLQNHLKGESKAVMFVNVGTEKSNLEQSLQSLVFAESVRECQVNQSKQIKK